MHELSFAHSSLFLHSPCLSFFLFFARTLERDHTIKPCCIYLVEMKSMFLHTSSVEAACISGVYVILILGSWQNSQQGSTKVWPNSTQVQVAYVEGFKHVRSSYGFGRNFLPLRSMWHYGFMTFLSKTISPSTLNRKWLDF
jgi:hypothetical protein